MLRRNLFVVVVMLSLIFSAAFTSWTQDSIDSGKLSRLPVSSYPPDVTSYERAAVATDATVKGLSSPGFFVVEVPGLAGGEPDIAINPLNLNQIVVHAGFGGWNGNAPDAVSNDGGITWTIRNQIPPPPGAPNTAGCPCDTAEDYGLDGNLYGTFLTNTTDIFSGSNTNPFANLFTYFLVAGNAQLTDFNGTAGSSDQPQLLTNVDPTIAGQTNTYVAYDDLFNGNERVSVARGTSPPNFVADNVAGVATGGGVNPGLRIANDPRTGFMYTLHQNCTANCGSSPKTIDYVLNRSLDAGATWTLNGNVNGIVVATGVTIQPTPKFGTVNALLGGIDHAAVNPTTGVVFVVYGGDNGTGGDGIFIKQITFNSANPTMAILGAQHRVSPYGVEAALPSVAVAPNGTVGVLYTSFDGFSVDGFPIFSGHFAYSTDAGVTFTDQNLLTFLSPAKEDGNINDRQRVLGDYQRLKVVNDPPPSNAGATFYGVFTGNGAALGNPVANNDPIFFKVTLAPQINLNPNPVTIGNVCKGSTGQAELDVSDTGADNLLISSVTHTSGSTDITLAPGPTFPVNVSPDANFSFSFNCTPTTFGAKTATFTIASNDPASPSTPVTVNCSTASGTVVVTGSGDFGAAVCGGGTPPTQTIKVDNVGNCNLNLNNAFTTCADFTLVNPPTFPVPISPDSGIDLTVKFTPTSAGTKSCNLQINTDDPGNPVVLVPLTGTTQTGNASISVPAGLTFPPTVIQQTAACNSTLGVPVANTGKCDVKVTNVALSGANVTDYALTGLSGLPLTIAPGGQLGTGDLNAVFAPLAIGRTRTASVDVTFENDPITHATAVKSVPLCGESVDRGVRVLVTQGGVPVPVVKRIILQKAIAPGQEAPIFRKNKQKNIPLTSVVGATPCSSFQFHTEYGGASDPTQLKTGTYRVKVKIAGFKTKIVRFNVGTCSFTPDVVVAF